MGYYIQTPSPHEKAIQIISLYDAKPVSIDEASKAIEDPSLAVIVVVENGPFDAAGFAFDRCEFDAFTHESDTRNKSFLTMDRSLAETLTDFRG